MHPASWEEVQGKEGAGDRTVLTLGASCCQDCEGKQSGNLFFPQGTVSFVPFCLSFSQWARFWRAGFKLPIFSGDALLTAVHMSSQAGLAGPPLRATLRLPLMKNPCFSALLSSEVLRRCKTSLWDSAKNKQKLRVGRRQLFVVVSLLHSQQQSMGWRPPG